jgi:putative ABC transport system permease protein
VPPQIGRVLNPGDDQPNTPLTAVLSYRLWQRSYGGDPNVLGRDIRLNGNSCKVIGVMPASFDFPPGEVNPAELWVPLKIDPAKPGGAANHSLSVLGVLRPRVSISQAQSELTSYSAAVAARTSQKDHGFSPDLHPLLLAGFQDDLVKAVRPAMLVLLGAVGFVLLIACVNVANLLLARAEARQREIAVRAAIGAGMGNLLRQFIVEGLMLSLCGAILGGALAALGLRLLVATNAADIPRLSEAGIDFGVLLFALGVCMLTGVIFGLAPLLHLKLSDLHNSLKAAAGRTTAGASSQAFRSALVASELALALVLLIGSGLMVRAFWKLQQVNSGIDSQNVLTMQVALARINYPKVPTINAFWAALLPKINALPGVVTASIANQLPPKRPINANDTNIEGFVPVANGPIQNVDYWNFITPSYFQAVKARLIEGRLLTDNDGAGAPLAVVINQTMARHFWPHESAIGHRVDVDFDKTWRTIVGVVADIKNAGIDQPAGTELFMPIAQTKTNPVRGAALVIRTAADPRTLITPVREQIHTLDRTLPISKVQTMDEALYDARARPRFLTLILTLFSTLSLSLAALGIYGVISYAVARRTSEIGIRMAMGASTGNVIAMIGASGLRLGLIGAAIGAGGAVLLTRFLSGMLFGISSLDPVTFVAMAAALLAVTLIACYIPARRASRVDPIIALRNE